MYSHSYKKLNIFPVISFLSKKATLKFALAISLIITILSLLAVQIARAINGQANTLLTETAQRVQLQADAPLISSDTEPVTAASAISTSTTYDQSGTDSNVKVIINGEEVPVPPNGTVNKELRNENGHSRVDISVQNSQVTTSSQTNSGSGSSYSHSYSSTRQTINGVPQ